MAWWEVGSVLLSAGAEAGAEQSAERTTTGRRKKCRNGEQEDETVKEQVKGQPRSARPHIRHLRHLQPPSSTTDAHSPLTQPPSHPSLPFHHPPPHSAHCCNNQPTRAPYLPPRRQVPCPSATRTFSTTMTLCQRTRASPSVRGKRWNCCLARTRTPDPHPSLAPRRNSRCCRCCRRLRKRARRKGRKREKIWICVCAVRLDFVAEQLAAESAVEFGGAEFGAARRNRPSGHGQGANASGIWCVAGGCGSSSSSSSRSESGSGCAWMMVDATPEQKGKNWKSRWSSLRSMIALSKFRVVLASPC